MRNRNKGSALLWLLIIIIFLVGEFFILKYNYFAPTEESQNTQRQTLPEQLEVVVPADTMTHNTVADVVEKTLPSVVGIRIECFPPIPNLLILGSLPEELRGELSDIVVGSGVIISADGYILTNQHVIENAAEITVRLTEGEEEYRAQLVKQDVELDLAVLKINPQKPLLAATIGDSDKIRVGEFIIAAGTSYDIGDTFTFGCINALGRAEEIEGKFYKELIQMNAPISPGNSGGPLINLQGEVVGIVTAADDRGIGFAIPINQAQDFLDYVINEQSDKYEENGDNEEFDEETDIFGDENKRLKTETTVDEENERPYLGIICRPVDSRTAKDMGIEQKGMLVVDVVDDGPAAKAKLQKNDVIFKIDDTEINGEEDLMEYLQKQKAGSTVTVHFQRGRLEKKVELTLTKR